MERKIKKQRDWALRLSNYTEHDVQTWDKLGTKSLQIKYFVFGKEVGEETHTPHLQGYIYFHNAKTKQQVKKFLATGPEDMRVHVMGAKGNTLQNQAYCTKDGDYHMYGQKPEQGKRTDLDEMKKMVNEGATLLELIQTAKTFPAMKAAETLIKYQAVPPKRKVEVYWYWGPTGCGKTYWACEQARKEPSWWKSGKTNPQFLNGYAGQTAAVFDELRAHHFSFTDMLSMLDEEPWLVNVKNSTVWWRPTKIWITTSKTPEAMWANRSEEDIEQLLRRITEIRHFCVPYNGAVSKPTRVEGPPVGETAAKVRETAAGTETQKLGGMLSPTSVPKANEADDEEKPRRPEGFSKWSRDQKACYNQRAAQLMRIKCYAEERAKQT